jgi:hypothetical protein
MFSSVTPENDHLYGFDPQLDPSAAGRRVVSRAAPPTAHPNDELDRPCSDL